MTGKKLKGWKAEYVDKLPAYAVDECQFEYVIRLRPDGKFVDTVGWKATIAGEVYGDFIEVHAKTNIKPKDLEALDPFKATLLQQFEATYKQINGRGKEPTTSKPAGQKASKKTGGKAKR